MVDTFFLNQLKTIRDQLHATDKINAIQKVIDLYSKNYITKETATMNTNIILLK